MRNFLQQGNPAVLLFSAKRASKPNMPPALTKHIGDQPLRVSRNLEQPDKPRAQRSVPSPQVSPEPHCVCPSLSLLAAARWVPMRSSRWHTKMGTGSAFSAIGTLQYTGMHRYTRFTVRCRCDCKAASTYSDKAQHLPASPTAVATPCFWPSLRTMV
jgi:hypothetical protein